MSEFSPLDHGSSASAPEVATGETPSLIAASKVEGTSVYDRNGDKLGTISEIMIDKISGKVGYAVLSFGGFLGLGSEYYPIPWSKLTYDVRAEGYLLSVERDQFNGAPSFSSADEPGWAERGYTRTIDEHYGTAIARGR